MNKKQINILIVGGCGLWAEKNHYSSIIGLKSDQKNVKVVAICDPIDPNKIEKKEKRDNLKKILKLDSPLWIDCANKKDSDLIDELNNLNKKYHLDAVIVSTNPIYHYFYCKWSLINKINLLCDKPLITTKNSSFDINQACLIQKNYVELVKLYEENKKQNPLYLFCSPLRRRALTPFIKVASELNRIYCKTGEGIRYMNVIINGGIHKYPEEYIKGGAHGHLDGIGTLSHSSYHYIDVLAWYLKMAKCKIMDIDISTLYVLRVGEYLKTKSYEKLREIIESNSKKFNDNIHIPNEVLNSELDFSFILKLKDKDGNQIGLITFLVNYSTFAPRLTKFNPEVTEYAHDKYGGRMSSVYFDIHQGAIQQWQIIKNDEVATGHNIDFRQRLHPRLGKKINNIYISNAYENSTFTSKDLFKFFIKACANKKNSKKHLSMLSQIDDQNLTMKLYSMMYEKIAEDFYNKQNPNKPIKSSSTIRLSDFF